MSWWVQLLVSGTGAALIAAVVNAVANRRKLSGEATKLITEAAGSVTQTIMADNARLRQDITDLKAEVAAMKQTIALAEERERGHQVSEDRNRAHLERWHRYCASHRDAMRAVGMQVADPPPLYPSPVSPPT